MDAMIRRIVKTTNTPIEIYFSAAISFLNATQ